MSTARVVAGIGLKCFSCSMVRLIAVQRLSRPRLLLGKPGDKRLTNIGRFVSRQDAVWVTLYRPGLNWAKSFGLVDQSGTCV